MLQAIPNLPERSDVGVADRDFSRTAEMRSKQTSVGVAFHIFRHDDVFAGTESLRRRPRCRAYRMKRGLPTGPAPKQSDNPDLVGNFGRMRFTD